MDIRIDWLKRLFNDDFSKRSSKKKENEIRELSFRFVSNCPSQNGPSNVPKFKELGYSHPSNYSSYKKRLFNSIALLQNEYKCFSSTQELYSKKELIISLYKKRKSPTIYFVKSGGGELDSLFYCLRNAFAHGNFFKLREYYIIWNDGTNHNSLKCFMMLKYEHLILIDELLRKKI